MVNTAIQTRAIFYRKQQNLRFDMRISTILMRSNIFEVENRRLIIFTYRVEHAT